MILKKTALLFLLPLLYCFSACEKKSQEEITLQFIEGYVTDAISGDSIKDALVELYEAKYGQGGNFLADYDRKIRAGYTDTNGFFKFYFNASNLLVYGLWAKKNLYSTNNDVSHFRAGITQTGFKLTPLSWIKYHIRNDSLALPSDRIFIYPNITLNGASVDTVFYKQLKAYSTNYAQYEITQNGQTSYFNQISNCASFDTCSYNIFY